MCRRNYSGQVGLILLIVMGVVIALAMSLASRSLSDTVLSRQEQESSVAFRLAETGVESALNSIRAGSPAQGTTTLPANGIFNASYGLDSMTTLSLFVREGDIASLNLTGYNTANPLVVAWTKKADLGEHKTCVGEGSGQAPAALEIISVQGGSSTVTYNYYNPSGCNIAGNGFTASEAAADPYLSQISYSVPAGTTEIRLRPLFADATVAVLGNGLATTQLYLIQAEAGGGDAKKEIEVKRGLDAAPSVFDFALFSGSTIVK